MEVAADPLVKNKGGKKGLKDMLKAAKMDDSAELPHKVVDLGSLDREIRRFLDNIGGPNSMALPPADKGMRKNIHELATAYNLKSQSKGTGAHRYTTLIKMTRSGLNVNEKKVRRILKNAGYNWNAPDRRGGGNFTASLSKHREGEEVGKVREIDFDGLAFR